MFLEFPWKIILWFKLPQVTAKNGNLMQQKWSMSNFVCKQSHEIDMTQEYDIVQCNLMPTLCQLFFTMTMTIESSAYQAINTSHYIKANPRKQT